MNARTLIRLLAYAIAIGAAIDPQIRSARPAPLAVALREPSGSLAQNPSRASGAHQAAKVRARLESAMPGALAINATGRATRARCRWPPARSVSAPCERAGVLRCARQGAGAGRSSRLGHQSSIRSAGLVGDCFRGGRWARLDDGLDVRSCSREQRHRGRSRRSTSGAEATSGSPPV